MTTNATKPEQATLAAAFAEVRREGAEKCLSEILKLLRDARTGVVTAKFLEGAGADRILAGALLPPAAEENDRG